MEKKISYVREKTTKSIKIVYDTETKSYKCRVKTTVKGLDAVLQRWDVLSVKEELLPLSEHPTKPTKVIETCLIIMREAIDYQTLKMLKGYFRQKIKVSVKDAESNIYLTYANGHIFMNDLVRGLCAPMQVNHTPTNLKLEKLGEPERISEQEKNELVKQGFSIYEEIMANGELRILA
jgi:hypothetical protein